MRNMYDEIGDWWFDKTITIDGVTYHLTPVNDQTSVNKPTNKEYAPVPHWGHKADLTEEFLSQTMVLDGIEYHRHRHGGGWVSEKADVEETVWIGPFAVVHNGVIRDQVILHDRATVNCTGLQDGADSNISDSARVYGLARVFGTAHVYGEGYLKKDTDKDIELKNWETIK